MVFIKEFMENNLQIKLINFKTSKNYKRNLKEVINILNSSLSDFILFPEVCLTGFDYENFDEVNKFGNYALKELSRINKTFALTLIYKNKNYFCFFDNGLIYKRAKYNLFGYENRYFEAGSEPNIFEWNNLKIANLICFEVRFIEYWEKFKGVDLIIVPARWGKERIAHFKILLKALSLSTQSQVIAVNSANEESFSCSFDSWSEGIQSNIFEVETKIDFKKNIRIRKKLNIGIK